MYLLCKHTYISPYTIVLTQRLSPNYMFNLYHIKIF